MFISSINALKEKRLFICSKGSVPATNHGGQGGFHQEQDSSLQEKKKKETAAISSFYLSVGSPLLMHSSSPSACLNYLNLKLFAARFLFLVKYLHRSCLDPPVHKLTNQRHFAFRVSSASFIPALLHSLTDKNHPGGCSCHISPPAQLPPAGKHIRPWRNNVNISRGRSHSLCPVQVLHCSSHLCPTVLTISLCPGRISPF